MSLFIFGLAIVFLIFGAFWCGFWAAVQKTGINYFGYTGLIAAIFAEVSTIILAVYVWLDKFTGAMAFIPALIFLVINIFTAGIFWRQFKSREK